MGTQAGHRATAARARASARNTAIDSLRTAMMCVVMFGHALLPYVTVPRRFQDPETHVAFDVAGVFLYAFAMQAFFVTAGFAAAALYQRRGASAFWRNRATRIFLPLVVGYALLTPLTRAAYEFAQAAGGAGSLAAGWRTLAAGEWLRWGKVYHLWFLASLLVFSAAAIAVQAVLSRLPAPLRARLDRIAGRALLGRWRVLALGIPVGLLTVPSYVAGTGQGTDGWMQAALFVFFLAGWLLYRHRDRMRVLTAHWWHGPVAALALLPLCAWATIRRLFEEGVTDPLVGTIAGVTNAGIAVTMTFGLLGWFQLRFAAQGRIGRYASAASYWIYLIHYPVVIAAAGLVSVLDIAAPAKYLLSVSIALPIILGSYHVLVRRSRLGGVLGGRAAATRGASPQ